MGTSNFSIKLYFILSCFLAITSTSNLSAQKAIKIYVNGKPVFYQPQQSVSNNRSLTCTRAENRSIDGTCNNIHSPISCEYGAAGIPLARLFPSEYADGLNSLAGPNRPNPRLISNIIVSQSGSIPSPKNLSSIVFTWGQFLDHDIGLSPESTNEHMDIPLPANEPLFTDPIQTKRTITASGSGTSNPREQVNIITAWIDGSGVYGSEQSRANWLRTFQGGKLRTSAGNLLPYNTNNQEANGSIDTSAPPMAGSDLGNQKTFVAGDMRAAEQPGLTAFHTLFVREHNRICDILANSGMDDESIYQRARKQVGGLIQKITFNEFLPALGLSLGSYQGYDPTKNPNINNEFSTAAYRIGHTMVTSDLRLTDANGIDNYLPLLACFFNISVIENNDIDPIIRGLTLQKQEAIDPFVVDALRNFLFPIPGGAAVFGLDLASLNIQRGRDHGLPDFMTARNSMFCDVIRSFAEINPDPIINSRLEQAYGNDLYSIDLWVGLLAEKKLGGKCFGPSMYQILQKQFKALRDGDFYYYENDPNLPTEIKNEIRVTSLRDVIERNTDIENLPVDIFHTF